MSMATNISRKLLMQPISGRLALMSAVVAVGLPTMLRLSLDGFVTGLAVAPYIPFIFLCAVLLVWWHAALVALVSAAVSDLLFVGPPNQMLEGPTDLLVIGLFLIVSAMAIGFVSAIRGLASQYRRPIHADRSLRGIIFSLEDNHACELGWREFRRTTWAAGRGCRNDARFPGAAGSRGAPQPPSLNVALGGRTFALANFACVLRR